MPGDVIAVYDLGGGTFDAAVLRKHGGRLRDARRPQGIERLGGIDFDEAVFSHVRGTSARRSRRWTRPIRRSQRDAAAARGERRCQGSAVERQRDDRRGDAARAPDADPPHPHRVRGHRAARPARDRRGAAPSHRGVRHHPRGPALGGAGRRVVAHPARLRDGERARPTGRPRRPPQAHRGPGPARLASLAGDSAVAPPSPHPSPGPVSRSPASPTAGARRPPPTRPRPPPDGSGRSKGPRPIAVVVLWRPSAWRTWC